MRELTEPNQAAKRRVNLAQGVWSPCSKVVSANQSSRRVGPLGPSESKVANRSPETNMAGVD